MGVPVQMTGVRQARAFRGTLLFQVWFEKLFEEVEVKAQKERGDRGR
jgi:hypothetical protein